MLTDLGLCDVSEALQAVCITCTKTNYAQAIHPHRKMLIEVDNDMD